MTKIEFLLNAHKVVKQAGQYNFQGPRVLLPSSFNFKFLEKHLGDYEDKQIIEFLKYGFPVDCRVGPTDPGIPNNHKRALEFPVEIQRLLDRECRMGGTLGPFRYPPFDNAHFSPLNSVPKKDSEERELILDLSYPPDFPSTMVLIKIYIWAFMIKWCYHQLMTW